MECVCLTWVLSTSSLPRPGPWPWGGAVMLGLKSYSQFQTHAFCFGGGVKPNKTSQLGLKLKSTWDCPWSYLHTDPGLSIEKP